ncbi:MAG: hypothetical protein AMQ22_00600 [Candidatus Methanofastidiosum methylothiophilum]|uniref:Uncharacterized protein n=1 Tax=Candidatus Methanofastidiosum methylothiophilum TaxID=1705564 RepID=A0A150J6D1_9EURY|nr:MAG: hypothetical protein AMQ22_00600 [Candidatus Methanofastidiosum methylthiophilus]
MNEYDVTWSIRCEGKDMKDASVNALGIMRDPYSTCLGFGVVDIENKKEKFFDLEYEDLNEHGV